MYLPFIVGIEEMNEMEEDLSERGCKGKLMDIICGTQQSEVLPRDLHIELSETRKFVTEKKFWSNVLNFNALFGLIITSFLYGFFR